MQIGELFTRSRRGETIDTRPCVHCGAPAIDVEPRTTHFEVADTGARTAWDDCFAMVRGQRKPIGTVATIGHENVQAGQQFDLFGAA